MVLKVFRYGEKVLREKAAPVAAVTDALRALADDMVETMHDSSGVGLAAQQVGRTERLCVIDMPPDCDDDEDRAFNAPIAMPLKMFNPEIVYRKGLYLAEEGCLSLQGQRKTKRHRTIKVQWQDRAMQTHTKNFTGWTAQIIQHEVDHCNGILI